MANTPEIFSVIFKIVVYAGIVQGIYSSLVLTHTKLNNPANQYLAILMLVLSFSIVHSAFIIPYFHKYHNTSFQIKEPFILLVVPFIWLYVKKLNEPLFIFSKKHLIHFVPFLIVMLFSLVSINHHNQNNNFQRYDTHTIILNIIVYFIAIGQYIFYLNYIFNLIKSFRIKSLNELSNTDHTDLAWLRIFLVTLLISILLLVIMMVIAIHRINVNYFNNIISFVLASIIYILGYKGLFQQAILTVKESSFEPANTFVEKLVTETKVDEALLSKIFSFMVNHKPYLDSELTLTSLAMKVEINRNQLSELINTGTNGNFYDFVNKYRVEEVKQLMENSKYKDYTILAIAFEAGFPSKSTFNSVFKKFTGQTPSDYRNRLL